MKILLFSTVIACALSLLSLVGVLRGPGLFRRLNHLVAAMAWGALGGLLVIVLVLLHLFQAFAGETLVATVTAQRLSPQEFELTYRPSPAALGRRPGQAGSDEAALHIRLQGDQWAVSGGIIKWHPWLTGLGMKSYHKLMRLSGQFSDTRRQRAHLPTVYAFSPDADRLWEAFYWAGRCLPFVEAVYGSAAYVYVEPSITQAVYVTPSGYLIKRSRQ